MPFGPEKIANKGTICLLQEDTKQYLIVSTEIEKESKRVK